MGYIYTFVFAIVYIWNFIKQIDVLSQANAAN
jgi:hypothetical protein